MIMKIEEGSPAYWSDLGVGDLITHVQDVPVCSTSGFQNQVWGLVGTRVVLSAVRRSSQSSSCHQLSVALVRHRTLKDVALSCAKVYKTKVLQMLQDRLSQSHPETVGHSRDSPSRYAPPNTFTPGSAIVPPLNLSSLLSDHHSSSSSRNSTGRTLDDTNARSLANSVPRQSDLRQRTAGGWILHSLHSSNAPPNPSLSGESHVPQMWDEDRGSHGEQLHVENRGRNPLPLDLQELQARRVKLVGEKELAPGTVKVQRKMQIPQPEEHKRNHEQHDEMDDKVYAPKCDSIDAEQQSTHNKTVPRIELGVGSSVWKVSPQLQQGHNQKRQGQHGGTSITNVTGQGKGLFTNIMRRTRESMRSGQSELLSPSESVITSHVNSAHEPLSAPRGRPDAREDMDQPRENRVGKGVNKTKEVINQQSPKGMSLGRIA